jgi:hypothetical protein
VIKFINSEVVHFYITTITSHLVFLNLTQMPVLKDLTPEDLCTYLLVSEPLLLKPVKYKNRKTGQPVESFVLEFYLTACNGYKVKANIWKNAVPLHSWLL